MNIKKSYNIDQLRDYSSLFSRGEVSRWFKNDFTSLNKKISRYDALHVTYNCTYVSYLKHIYKILERYYPNEYVYKNEFINKQLIKELGGANSVIYSEFRLGKAVADMVMFNGNSKVFEIKTLLDKDSRLSNQLHQYGKLFNEVYVIAPKSKIDKYLDLDDKTGVIFYDEVNGNFSVIKQSAKNSFIDVDILMQVLHTHEYINIVENHYGCKPSFNDFNKFNICKNLIKQIPFNTLNEYFVELMKERKINNEFCKKEKHLNQIFLSLNLSFEHKQVLLKNLSSNITH
ncbi:MAG: sce7726 family protein [Chitinophagaceae bacterium]